MFEIRDFAGLIYVHPVHLSNTIKAATGYAPCYFFEKRLMDISKSMLENTHTPISEIVRILTYDPSNFTKFFKHFAGQIPKQYREAYLVSLANKALTTASYLTSHHFYLSSYHFLHHFPFNFVY